MSNNKNHKAMRRLFLALGLLASTASLASWSQHGGNWYEGYQHYHGYDNYYNQGWSYGGGGFYFGSGNWGGFWGGGPNIVINLPAQQYYAQPEYVPECQHVETCNSYGNCWLEPVCD
ncbi:hypothetical protein BN59_03068 [Legionella massiliensis]|uniref:Glycine-rich protein n=1 Tax=Legionella massiliensis TaxID=1034943 RepID=A0A078L3Q6_9GAMM|nr:hypothetical protein [Legionella massiliensis]CDZ78754.1 hypothetical protein BN59_03068 [Legionella massiliensis]CEE14492.1 hypothetical protein BN1094_03068 [Legionella massiliensis]